MWQLKTTTETDRHVTPERYMADRSGFSRIVGSLGRSYVVRHPRSTCTWWTRIWIEFCCICSDIYILLHLFWHLQIVRNPSLFGYARTKTVSHVLRQKRFTNICIAALIDFSKRRFIEEWKSAKIEKRKGRGEGGGGGHAHGCYYRLAFHSWLYSLSRHEHGFCIVEKLPFHFAPQQIQEQNR